MKGMSIIVKTISDIVKGFILLFGIYIILEGHLSPGGGFAGGVIIAAAFILITLAFGSEREKRELSYKGSHILDEIGVFLFLSMAVTGYVLVGQPFFNNFITKMFPGIPFNILTSGIILVCNIAIGIKVGASLFAIFAALASYESPKEESEE
jgi:multisubunit Na+/H+ antiporter MnhB subunit